MNDLTRAFAVRDDIRQNFPNVDGRTFFFTQKPLAGLSVAEDGGQGLIELVRNRSRNLSQQRYSRNVRKFQSIVLRLDLGPDAVWHVDVRDDGPGLRASQWFNPHLKPARWHRITLALQHELRPVACQHGANSLQRLLRRRVAGSQSFPADIKVVGTDVDLILHPGSFGSEPDPGFVDCDDAARAVYDRDMSEERRNDGGIERLLPYQFDLEPLLVGQINYKCDTAVFRARQQGATN